MKILKFTLLIKLVIWLFGNYSFAQNNYKIELNQKVGNVQDGVYLYSPVVETTGDRWFKAKAHYNCKDSLIFTINTARGTLNRCNLNINIFRNPIARVYVGSFTCNTTPIKIPIHKDYLPSSLGESAEYVIAISPKGLSCDNKEVCVGVDGKESLENLSNSHIIASFKVTAVNIAGCELNPFSFTSEKNKLKVNFYSNILPLNEVNYIEWDFGDDSPVNRGFNPGHTYKEAGTYTVTMTAYGDCFCFKSYSNIVSVYCSDRPEANFDYSIGINNQVDFSNKIQYFLW